MCPQDAWTPTSQCVHTCPDQDVKLLPCFQFKDSGPESTKEQKQTMNEFDYVEKNIEKLPIGSLPWPTGPPAPVYVPGCDDVHQEVDCKWARWYVSVNYAEVKNNDTMSAMVKLAKEIIRHRPADRGIEMLVVETMPCSGREEQKTPMSVFWRCTWMCALMMRMRITQKCRIGLQSLLPRPLGLSTCSR